MEIEKVVGGNVRRIREQRLRITQEELGRRIGALRDGEPWSRATISAAEGGGRAFAVADIVTFAQALAVLPGALLLVPEDVSKVIVAGVEVNREDVQRPGDMADPDAASERVYELTKGLAQIEADADAIRERVGVAFEAVASVVRGADSLHEFAGDMHMLGMQLRREQFRYVDGAAAHASTAPDAGE